MQTILLKPLVHRGQECIGIYYANYPSLNKIIVKQVGAKWSKTHKCWYILLNKENHIKLVDALKGNAIIQQGGLYHYLTEKRAQLHQQNAEQLILPKKVQFINAVVGNEKNCISVKAITNLVKEQVKGPNQIHAINRQVLPKMQEHLILKAYSPSTIKTYLNELSQLLQKLGNIPADELNTAHLKRYFVYCFEQLKLSENTLHSRINAIKFYYEQVLGREKLFWEIPRPKKAQQLPRFFSQEDIIAIIKATGNLKHRVMLMLAYSAGLRVSEVVAMKTCNIDSGRMSILIERAKGKKDRVAGLSPALLVMLREYAKQYKPDPNGYLFGGQEKGEPYSTRSMQMVIANAKEKAGILKPGSVHALRHSFATHLLDKGTDVTIIMKLLGHNDLKTTLRYLHVTNRDILKIISPLDDLKF